MSDFRMYIDGSWCEAASGASYEAMNPARGEPFATVARGDREDARRAIAAANRAHLAGRRRRCGNARTCVGGAGPLWILLHEGVMGGVGGPIPIGGTNLLVIYPLLPWIGVMLLGHELGPWTALARPARRRRFGALGLALTAGFLALRSLDVYGEPVPWAEQESGVFTVLSFLNCTKYPPSLLFLAMTLGPALVALALLDREPRALGRAFVTFGRVPLFFYVAHLWLGHGAARLYNLLLHGEAFSPLIGSFTGYAPDWFEGFPLWGVWLAWLAVVLALLPFCAAYARLKRRSDSPLLSYL